MAESEEELKSLSVKVKEESKKVGLKLNIENTKIMASGPITSWEIDGETVETVRQAVELLSLAPSDLYESRVTRVEAAKAGPNYKRREALKIYFESEVDIIRHLLYLNWVSFTLMKK